MNSWVRVGAFLFSLLGVCGGWRVRGEQESIVVRADVRVPMRDDVRLSTNVFLPGETGTYPTILVRTPYGKGDENHGPARRYAGDGYVYLVQDTRGRGASEGRFDPMMDEADDGEDTLRWIITQPWSNGKVGMSGGSYVGYVQWAAASRSPPGLVAIAPMVTFGNFHDDVAYPGGAFQLALALGWGAAVTAQPGENLLGLDWQELFRALPLVDYSKTLRRNVDFYDRWLEHPGDGAFWHRANVSDRYGSMRVAALHVGNWYDIFARATAEGFRRMREEAPSEEIRRAQKLILGPGAHGEPAPKLGEREFGPAAKIDVAAIERRWFDRWLKDVENGILEEPPVKIFVMGINEWRDEDDWPLARARPTRFYLRSGGGANGLGGDGVLSVREPGTEPPDAYLYDPRNPVPTHGGANLLVIPSGPFDQRMVESRRDVLVYTSEPLERPLEATGPVTVKLFASSSAPDTDFTAKLVDVCPDGTAWNLADGIVRARYRLSDRTSRPIEPGRIYAYTIDLWVTSNVFLEGHRIRLEIASSNFPRFDRNPNTGRVFARDGAVVVAEQTVFHDERYPSCLILPMVP